LVGDTVRGAVVVMVTVMVMVMVEKTV